MTLATRPPPPAPRWLRTTPWLLGAVLWLLAGCGLPGGDLIVYDVGSPELAEASVSEGVWESAPWSSADAPWMAYPARATVQVEHTLPDAPRSVLVYLSFEPRRSEPALAAGDLSRIVAVDETTISVRNDTSASFFARIVAF